MGLDQRLTRKHYVQNWDHTPEVKRHKVTVEGPAASAIKPERISCIEEQVHYWRKANAIHKWFIDNCQKGIDDCRDAWVSEEQLKKLLKLCQAVKANSVLVRGQIKNGQKLTNQGLEDVLEDGQLIENESIAHMLLPTSEGFFFGSTEYDEYYISDIEDTIKALTNLLAEDNTTGEYYYSSSW